MKGWDRGFLDHSFVVNGFRGLLTRYPAFVLKKKGG